MTLLRLGKESAKEIAEFFKANFSDGWTEDMISSAFNGGRFNALSLIDGGQAVGILTFSVSDETADIEDVVVRKDARERGYGGRLLQSALEEIKSLGVSRVMLEVREGNIPAINLYEKCGFVKISTRKKYYLDGENAIVMLKE